MWENTAGASEALLRFFKEEMLPQLAFTLKWTLLATIIAFLAGSASAFFLVALDWVGHVREANPSIIWALPLAGLLIGYSYHRYGQEVVKGNNQLLDEFYRPAKTIPLRMAPLVLAGTLVTHLFGGSAGREGTAVQMGGALSDQFSKWFPWVAEDRRILITIGVAAGFASVFGTPLAGAVFALEWLIIGRIRYEAILPAFIAAFVADFTCAVFWAVPHTHYSMGEIPEMDLITLLWLLPAGIAFGLAGRLFAKATHFWSALFSRISYPPLRPVLGGLLVAAIVFGSGTTKYIGLGVPTIVDAFDTPLPWYDFLAKIGMTSLTLGAGFKGGEVTPLFYTGATLGNALSQGLIPLPMGLLAGLGFVGVFSGATNTPLACTFMGLELFGMEAGIAIGIVCVVAYLFSGHAGIYNAQVLGSPKHKGLLDRKGKRLGEL
ncbi:MAG: voltage-gated chloride channel family protein [Nitritalea sp.]